MNVILDPKSVKHPCFNKASSGSCGRVHLPVAPKCNIQCNYCNRKYDCVNESRPGVTSAILKPFQALEYTRQVLEKEPRITVIGIAGPGDPMRGRPVRGLPRQRAGGMKGHSARSRAVSQPPQRSAVHGGTSELGSLGKLPRISGLKI